MATEGDVARMRSEVSAIRSENARIQREINMMVNSLDSALGIVKSTQSTAIGALQNGDRTLTGDDNTLHGVEDVEQDIRKKVVLYKNVENAYKNIRALNNELRYQQGDEKTVKRMVTAIIDNEDKKLVSEDTLIEQAEKLHVRTQYFFLSYIMMDLQLRKRGSTEAADRAQKTAVDMEPRKSAWVYFMIALKRNDVAEEEKWFNMLMQHPVSGSEKEQLKMLMMLSLKESGGIADKVRRYIGLDDVHEIDSDELVSNILHSYHEVMAVKPPKFEYIDKHIDEHEKLNEALFGAMNNEEIAAYIQTVSLSNEEKMRNDIIGKMLDGVIESCNSPKSKEINEQIEYNQSIIEAHGVMDEAMAKHAQQKVESVADIKIDDCLYEWLTDKERYNGKREVDEFAYSKLKPCYIRAYKEYVSEYQKKYSMKVTMDLGGYKTQTMLSNVGEEELKIGKFCRNQCERTKAAIKNTKFILCVIFGALLLVGGIVLNFLGGSIGETWAKVGLFAGVIIGAALLFLGVISKYKNYKAKLAADDKCAQDIVMYIEKMHYVFNDLASYREMYRQYDNKRLGDDFF